MGFDLFDFTDNDVVEFICCINDIFDLDSPHREVVRYLIICEI